MNLHLHPYNDLGLKQRNAGQKGFCQQRIYTKMRSKFFEAIAMCLMFVLSGLDSSGQVKTSVPHINSQGGRVMVVITDGGGGGAGGGCSFGTPVVDAELTCGSTTGTLTVTSPTGSNYTYALNGGQYQSSPTFNNVPAGESFTVSVSNGSCTSSFSGTMIEALVPLTVNVTRPTCINTSGTVTVTAPVGPDFQYSNNAGTYQDGTSFSLAAGSGYSITVRQVSTGCVSAAQSGTIGPVPILTNAPTVDVTAPTCTNSGIVTVTYPVGGDFLYSDDAGNSYQSTTDFSISGNTTYHIFYKGISTGCISPVTSGTMAPVPSSTWYADADGDGFGNPAVSQVSCSQPAGYVSNANDCNDNNPAINPNTVWVLDADNDGYYTGSPVTQCTSPGAGYVIKTNQQPGDCMDNNAAINPATVWYKDNDGDGYTDGKTHTSCVITSSGIVYDVNGIRYVLISLLKPSPGGSLELDCDDNNRSVYPGAPGSSCYGCPAGGIIYVKKDATGNNDGTSWANAFTSLQTALYQGCPNVQIWVAKGTYYPDEGIHNTNNDRNAAFKLKEGVAVYGGFAGNETSLNQRDWKANETILSGDIDQNDGANFMNNSGNSYHVVANYQNGLTNSTILDGFTISGGNADYAGTDPSLAFDKNGGGITNVSSSPAITNCIFVGNTSVQMGGGVYNENAQPQFTNCTFSANAATDGGAVYNNQYTNANFYNCSFLTNTASDAGGGMYNNSSITKVLNSKFVSNQHDAIDNRSQSSLNIINSIFSRNTGTPILNGFISGGLRESGSTTTITNCSFSNNERSVANDIGDMFVYNSISDKVIANNSPVPQEPIDPVYQFVIKYTDAPQLDVSQNHNISIYPLFVDATQDNLRLQATSPAINAGDDTLNSEPLDLDGNPRKVGTIDMGAYEYQGTAQATTTTLSSTGSLCVGSAVTLTATVSSAGIKVSSGTVTFSEGTVKLAENVALNSNGQATFTTSTLSAGSHTILATYNNSTGYQSSSNSKILLINPVTAITSDVATTPYEITVNGTSPQLSVVATGTFLSYQWFRNSSNSNTGGTSIANATTSSYSPDVSTTGTSYYYVIVTGTCGTITSKVATINVQPAEIPPVAGTISGATSVCSGTNSTLLTLNDYTGTIQWQSATASQSFTDIADATGSSYTASNLTTTTSYRAVVSSGGTTATTTAVSITVTPNASAGVVTAGTSPQCIGSTTTYTVSGAVLAGGTGAWSSDNTAVATVDPSIGLVTATGAGTANIIYTVTGGCGSTATASQPYSVTPNASAGVVTAGTSPQCIGSTTTYTVSGAVLAGGTGAWSSDNTAVATVDPSTGLVTAKGAGTANIIYTVTGGCGSTATASQSYVVSPTTTITSSPANVSTPALDNTSFTVAASGAGTLSYQWQISTDAGNSFTNVADNSTYSGTSGTMLTLTGAAINMNGYQYQCVVTGTCGTATSTATTLTVTRRPTVITYTGDNNEQYSDLQTLTASLIDQETNSVLANQPVTFALGNQSASSATDASGNATATLNMYQDAGQYSIISSFAGDDIYAASSDTDPFTITKENAITAYTGPEFISVPCATCASTQLLLTASVIDTSALYPANDPYPGDIRKARVKFVNLDNMQDISGWLTPGLVNAADSTSGIVSYNWTVPLPTTGYNVYTIGLVVDNNYTGTSQSVLSVSRSSLTQFITGGGHVIPTNSSGMYASDAGSKVNFGFNVKYNKTGKNLQGNMNIIFRRAGRVYQIKATSMTSLSINTQNACSQKATFVSKANLIDITDENNPVSVYGGITLQTTITDNGEPGTNDLTGITLLNNNTLIYSSNWVSKKTTEMLLNGGNIQVNSGVVCSNTIATRNEAVMDTEEPASVPIAISVSAYPNPLRNQTLIEYKLPAAMHVSLAVYDIMGKKIAQLREATEAAGVHTVKFDASGKASGVYIYSLNALDDTGKVTVINGKLIIGR